MKKIAIILFLLLLVYGCSSTKPPTQGAPSCSDAIINQNETDIDCGDFCNGCKAGRHCLKDSDCQENYCKDGVCSLHLVCDVELLMKEKETRAINYSNDVYNFAVVDVVDGGAVITVNNNPSPRLQRFATYEGDSFNLTVKDIKLVNDQYYVSICLLVKFAAAKEEEKEIKKCFVGDANDDGTIGKADYDLIFRISKGMEKIMNNVCCVDINKDGRVNKVDMGLVMQIMQGQMKIEECSY